MVPQKRRGRKLYSNLILDNCMFPLWTGAVNQNGEPCELLWLRIEICFHLWCCLRCWKMMCDEGRIKYIVSFFYSLWVKNDFLPFWGTLIRSFEAVPIGLWLDESPPYRPPGNTWTFSLGCPTLHYFCSLPSVWSLCRNARSWQAQSPSGSWAPFTIGAHLLAGIQLLTASPRLLCGGCWDLSWTRTKLYSQGL